MQVLMKITKIKNLKGPPFFFLKKKKEEKKVNLNSIFKVWIHYIHLRNCKFSNLYRSAYIIPFFGSVECVVMV